jgi:hypothetical protein
VLDIIIVTKYTRLNCLSLGDEITSDFNSYFSVFSKISTLKNFINLGENTPIQ